MRFFAALFLLLASASFSGASDPSPPTRAPSIVVAPGSAKLPAPPTVQSVKLSGAEFELLTLKDYAGAVTWDVTTPDNSAPPVKLFELKPKETIVGIRAGFQVADRHESPDAPSVALFATGTGSATLAAWGVVAAKPVKLATFTIEAGVVLPVPIPIPIPPTPVPPAPPAPIPEQLGFATLAQTEAMKLPAEARKLSAAIADNFGSVSARLAAGSLKTPDAANAELRDLNRATLGTAREAWLPWFTAWQKRADQLNASNNLTTSAHYVTAYKETADGLRAVK